MVYSRDDEANPRLQRIRARENLEILTNQYYMREADALAQLGEQQGLEFLASWNKRFEDMMNGLLQYTIDDWKRDQGLQGGGGIVDRPAQQGRGSD